MPYDTGIPARLERFGIPFRTVSGWQTRGSSTFFPRGAVNHHTAGASRAAGVHPSLGVLIHGRSDLNGPLCQVSMDYNGLVYVIAAGRANHAGIPDGGSWRGLTGNTSVWGLEIEHPGTFPLEPERYALAAKVHAALISGTVGPDKVGQHWEWSPSRKIDLYSPRTLDPAHFRARVAHYLANPEEEIDMALTNDDITKIRDAVWSGAIEAGGGFPEAWSPARHLRTQSVQLETLLERDGADVDEQAIAAAVLAGLKPAEIAEAIAAALGPEVGQQVVDALGTQLAK